MAAFAVITLVIGGRITNGIDLSDEAYYAIFLDDWLKGGIGTSTLVTLHQTAALIVYPAALVYSTFNGSHDRSVPVPSNSVSDRHNHLSSFLDSLLVSPPQSRRCLGWRGARSRFHSIRTAGPFLQYLGAAGIDMCFGLIRLRRPRCTAIPGAVLVAIGLSLRLGGRDCSLPFSRRPSRVSMSPGLAPWSATISSTMALSNAPGCRHERRVGRGCGFAVISAVVLQGKLSFSKHRPAE